MTTCPSTSSSASLDADWLPIHYDGDTDHVRWKHLPGCTFQEAFFDWCIDGHERKNGPGPEAVTALAPDIRDLVATRLKADYERLIANPRNHR